MDTMKSKMYAYLSVVVNIFTRVLIHQNSRGEFAFRMCRRRFREHAGYIMGTYAIETQLM